MRKIYKNEKSTEMRERGFAGNALYHASCSITVSAIFVFVGYSAFLRGRE